MPAMELMIDNVRKIPFLKLVGSCRNTFNAGETLLKEKVDLIFSDIEMPIISGIQFIKTLKNPPLIILTTAYEQYALEGYELDVIDYLLKPFSFDRFFKAVTKAQEQLILRNEGGSSSKKETYLFVHSEYKEIKIRHSDICYVEGLKDYVKIHLESQKHPILTRLNLKGIEAKLPETMFCRIHNSFIVPLNKISSTQKTKIYLGEKTLPLGTAYYESFMKKYKSTN